ncbi:unnamed protein product [Absidia cylindrospora]
MCMYSMILKSKPLESTTPSTSANMSPTAKSSSTAKIKLSKKQHSHILQQKGQSPSSPTPSDQQQQQSFRVDSSASQRIIDTSSRLLDHDADDIPFRPQSKGKKVSIDPTLGRNTTPSNDDDDDVVDTSRHNGYNGDPIARSKKRNDQASWKNSINIDDSNGDDNYKNKVTSLFDSEDGFSDTSAHRSPNTIHERLLSHRQNSKLSFQPLDTNWKPLVSTANSTNQRQQEQEREQQQQRAGQNEALLDTLMKDMEEEVLTLQMKTNYYEANEAQHKDQIEELTGQIEKLKSQANKSDENYQVWHNKFSDQVSQLQGKMKQGQAELDSTRNDLLAAKHKCLELQNESAHWKTTVEKMEDERAALRKEMDNQKSLREKLELELDLKDHSLKKSQARIEELEEIIPPNLTAEKVQETLAMVDQLQHEKQACDTIINNTVNELASMTKGYEGLQQKVKELERQRDQQLKDMAHTTSQSPLWYQRETINQDKKRLSSVCKQLDAQANVIEQLRLQILSSGAWTHQNAMEKKPPRWLIHVLWVLGLLLVLMVTAAIYATNSPPLAYGLWNDPHGYQGQWLPDAPVPRNKLLLILDRLLLPDNFTFTPPM